ncbi:unnamed protein product [Brassica rapa]|uniref:Uncharacterized protein n=1 Tax=Brassica campestris TaxID=3711 RepID=A0A8D9H2F3_BRACM|nr:unnamed protein product [Brassica rapa]
MDESIREMHGKDFGDRVISSWWQRQCGYSFAGKGSFGGHVDLTVIPTVTDMWTVNTGLTAEKPTSPADRFAGGDRYSRGPDCYTPASYDKPRSFERDIVSSAGSDRYGGGRAGVHIRGGDEGRGFRSRAGGPYERPSRSVGGGGHMSSATFDRY